MASFTVRVELHDAVRDDYLELHDYMRRQGFTTTIRSDGGQVYHLPPAEYVIEGPLARAEVLERAKNAAAAVKSGYAVLVTEASGWTWVGLTTVR